MGLRSEEHTSELQSLRHLVCRLLLEKKKNIIVTYPSARDGHPHLTHLGLAHGAGTGGTAEITCIVSADAFMPAWFFFFFFNDTATTEIYTLSLHDALPISSRSTAGTEWTFLRRVEARGLRTRSEEHTSELQSLRHLVCRLLLVKKKQKPKQQPLINCLFCLLLDYKRSLYR